MRTNLHSPLSIPRLRVELVGEVIGPEDAAYEAARRVFNPVYDDRRPAAIVRPAR